MATYFLVILITLVLMSVYILGVLSENLYENQRVQLFAKANIISDMSVQMLEENNDYMQREIVQTLAGTDIRALVLNAAYTVLCDTTDGIGLKGKVYSRDIIKTALSGEQASSIDRNENEINMMSVAVPMKNSDTIIGAVYLMSSVEDVDKTIGYIQTSQFIFSALISVLVGMLSLGMSYVVTSPIDEVIVVAKAISKGDFSKRARVNGKNELAQMASTLNYMCDELEMIEEKRRKFVSDASHELKTPLATIKLICDSIVSTENPDSEMVREFLSDLSDEVDRLTRIVERLLMLTKMDSGTTAPKFETVDPVSLINAVVRKLTPTANSKNIALYAEVETENTHQMMLDYDKIWEAVYNITDNAIKYSPDGGYVKVSNENLSDSIVIKIEDNGPGIPDGDKERVFERFYRLDDSRARDTGGTGLGLAIAKEAVVMHGGTIEILDSEENGCIFKITIPYTNN